MGRSCGASPKDNSAGSEQGGWTGGQRGEQAGQRADGHCSERAGRQHGEQAGRRSEQGGGASDETSKARALEQGWLDGEEKQFPLADMWGPQTMANSSYNNIITI